VCRDRCNLRVEDLAATYICRFSVAIRASARVAMEPIARETVKARASETVQRVEKRRAEKRLVARFVI
jgi:hypothetical protein